MSTLKRPLEVSEDAILAGPASKKVKITEAQKQALVDNLQLEGKTLEIRIEDALG